MKTGAASLMFAHHRYQGKSKCMDKFAKPTKPQRQCADELQVGIEIRRIILSFPINMPKVAGGVRHNARTENLIAKYAVLPPGASAHKRTRNADAQSKRPPTTRLERQRRQQNRKLVLVEMRKKIAAMRRSVREECIQLGKLYNKKPRYFLDMFFQGGVRVSKPSKKPNPFNAFKSRKSKQRRAAGLSPMTVQQIQTEFKDEYDSLTPEGRKKMVNDFEAERDLDTRERIKAPSVKEKMADTSSSITQATGILKGHKLRVGSEAMLLVVKNRPERIMKPQWFFMDDRIRRYLPTILRGFDCATVGKKVEALAVVRCDATALIKNQKDQADALKTECSLLIQEALDEACSTKGLGMQYEQFDKLTTLHFSVVCEGWPPALPFQKPVSFGGNTNQLFMLRDSWRDGVARFRRLDRDEFEEWKAARMKGIADGTVVVKTRKKRNDAGKPRGKRGKPSSKKPEEAEASSSGESGESDDDDDDLDGEKIQKEPLAKPTAAQKTKAPKTPKALKAAKAPKTQTSMATTEAQVTQASNPGPSLSIPPTPDKAPRLKPRRVVPKQVSASATPVEAPLTAAPPSSVDVDETSSIEHSPIIDPQLMAMTDSPVPANPSTSDEPVLADNPDATNTPNDAKRKEHPTQPVAERPKRTRHAPQRLDL
ncbi:hypothetical protein PQX77_018270 [Marasmius sp. AFHP31]|nr:hypothetical protein PQX77_018270 [Marasmius sp. AFHP31]